MDQLALLQYIYVVMALFFPVPNLVKDLKVHQAKPMMGSFNH